MPIELKSITLRGFKSYRALEGFQPGRLTVLLGGNGAGKSNFLSFFTLMHRMLADPGELALAVGKAGGAGRILHHGPKETTGIEAILQVATENGLNTYDLRLEYAAGDQLVTARENWTFHDLVAQQPLLGGGVVGRRESYLNEQALNTDDQTARVIRSLLRKCVVYQFHDTSFTSRMRAKSVERDGKHLHGDGSNIAAFLYNLGRRGDEGRAALKRIQDSIRQVLPFFAAFRLEPEEGHVLLRWRERGEGKDSDYVFDASQASDGMLRIIALWTLLRQPVDSLPALMLLDEPELGLHPQAITFLGALIRHVSRYCQVIVATQSPALVDQFRLEEIVEVSREGRESSLVRKTDAEFGHWLDEYSTGELWRKNILGGGPGE